MSEPAQKCENYAIFKQNYTTELLIAFKMVYSCFFGLRGKLDFPDFLQKSFITLTTGPVWQLLFPFVWQQVMGVNLQGHFFSIFLLLFVTSKYSSISLLLYVTNLRYVRRVVKQCWNISSTMGGGSPGLVVMECDS